MKVLLIETCGSEASIALADTEASPAIVASAVMPGRTASEKLIGSIREVMSGQGWELRELTAIAVVCGPGSFTGVRVGLSAAKGLSEASGIPLVGVSRLALLAADNGSEVEGHEVCAILDAGRGEFYCGRYVGLRCLGESLLSLAEAIKLAQASDMVILCETKVQQAFAPLFTNLRICFVPEPPAAHALPLILQRMLDSDHDYAAHLDANYLRSSDQQIFAKPATPSAPTTIVQS